MGRHIITVVIGCHMVWTAACSTVNNADTTPSGTDTMRDGDSAKGDTATEADSSTGSPRDSETDTASRSDGDTDTVADTGTDSDTDTDTDSDGDTDTDSDADTDTDSDADTDTDTTDTDTATPDSDSAPPGETDTTDIHDDSDARSTDSETDTRVPYTQPTIKVKVTNKTATPKYLDNWFQGGFMEIDVLENGEWQRYYPMMPPCTAPCNDESPGDACCMDGCDGPPSMLFVLNTEKNDNWVDHMWYGVLYTVDDAHCSDCACHREETVLTGRYRARVCAYNEVTCDTPADCEPPLPTGPFNAGRVAGDVICYAAEFDVPYDEEYVYLDISTDTIVII